MKSDIFNVAIGLVDGDLIAEAAVAEKNKKVIAFKRVIVLAACFIILCLGTIGVMAAAGFDFRSAVQEFYHNTKITRNNKTVAALVNGEPIYKSTVDFQREYHELSYKTGISKIESLDIPEEKKQKYLADLEDKRNETDEEILDTLIENQVLMKEAQKQGIQVSYEKAYNQETEQFKVLKKAALRENAEEIDKNNYLFITEYMKSMNMTEEEYLEQAANVYRTALMRGQLLKNFSATISAQKDQSEIDAQVNEYVKNLVEKADIKKY